MFYSTTCVRLRYGYDKNMFRGFSWKPVYHRYPIVRGRSVLSSSTGRTDLPIQPLSTLFNLLFRQQADVSLLRLPVTLYRSNGILTVSSIGIAVRLSLRTRLECSPTDHINDPTASVDNFIPDYYPRPTPRLVSCYALFK